MSQRTKRFILPAMAVLWAFGVVLVFLDRAAALQRLIWIACMAMLVWAAASEGSRLNQRTRSFWLPGFIAVGAASLVLISTDFVYNFSCFFREIALHPQDLVRSNSAAPHLSYFVWLLAQVAFGTIGAFFSSRMGGTRAARLLAGAFPAAVILGTYVLMIPVTSMITGKVIPSPLPQYLGSAMCVWVLAPAMGVALGAAPFLRKSDAPFAPESEV